MKFLSKLNLENPKPDHDLSKQMIHSSYMGILFMNSSGINEFRNSAISKILKYQSELIVGQQISIIFSDDDSLTI
jgi:transcriptional regulator with PAS, ATPase and Fis domain